MRSTFFGREKKVCPDVEAICEFTSTLEQIAIHILDRGVYGGPSWNTARSNIGVIFRINILQSFPWHSWVKLCFKHNEKGTVWSHNSPKLLRITRTQQRVLGTPVQPQGFGLCYLVASLCWSHWKSYHYRIWHETSCEEQLRVGWQETHCSGSDHSGRRSHRGRTFPEDQYSNLQG